MLKSNTKQPPDFDAGTIEELHNKINLLDSQLEELNSNSKHLEEKNSG